MATLNRKDLRTTTCAMQHRHFATIAAIIRELPSGDDTRGGIAQHFAAHLRHTNPNFNRDRFLAACGALED
jgi:hypothetical protein